MILYDESQKFEFPYEAVNDELIYLIKLQYLSDNVQECFTEIGEQEIIGFVNRFYHFLFYELEELRALQKKNPLCVTEEEMAEFFELSEKMPERRKDPLTLREYLHMCRIGFDAAPDYIYPDYMSDLFVVTQEKFDSCNITKKDMDLKMEPGEPWMERMYYHPEEMGFGGPEVYFDWNEDGWIMYFDWELYERKNSKNIKRFLAMRKAGYPVFCPGMKEKFEKNKW